MSRVEPAPAVGARCPVCGADGVEPWVVAEDIEYRTSSERFTYRHCTPCDVLFPDPMPVDRLAEIYPST